MSTAAGVPGQSLLPRCVGDNNKKHPTLLRPHALKVSGNYTYPVRVGGEEVIGAHLRERNPGPGPGPGPGVKPEMAAKGSREPRGVAEQHPDVQTSDDTNSDVSDPFEELEQRFKIFKKENFLKDPVHFESLARAQAPKFMVIACADSRVCPSKILGFQPGEAFTVRNVANLVPPFQYGTSETGAALEFAVNSLKVRNILVVGHSRCGGIQALMSMKEKSETGNFIKDWVSLGKSARLSTEAAAGNLSFEQQCKHCEKESINGSMLNLLTYPWIEANVMEGKLAIHGGHYDFVDCTFEKWTLVYRKNMEGGSKYGMKNHTFWN